MGEGALIKIFRKKKMNAMSYTEKVSWIDNAIPQILCTKYLFEAQGNPTKENIIHKDNQNTIILEKNGKSSS